MPDMVKEMMNDGLYYMPSEGIVPFAAPQAPGPYAKRFARSLAKASETVMNAMDDFHQKQQLQKD